MKYLILFFCICNIAVAAELSFKEKMRPYINNIIGTEWTQKIIGVAPDIIEMPTLPKVDRDAKSTAIYKKDRAQKEISSEEARKYNLLYLYELYPAVRNTKVKPNNSDISKWINVMNQGATREGVYRAIVLDDNYQGLENYEVPHSDSAIRFAISFMEKYLNKKVAKDALERISFFTTKRIAVEKSLDLMDSFAIDNDDIYNWYALFSSELALKYPTFWKNKMRKMTSTLAHKKWAKAVPMQHMKSELIIKIHKVMNLLNAI